MELGKITTNKIDTASTNGNAGWLQLQQPQETQPEPCHRRFLLDLQRHLCDQGTKFLPDVKFLWYFTLQNINSVSRKSYSNVI